MNKQIEYNELLKKYFGYEKLKPEQFEIIDKVVNENKDVLAVLATGFGKSITYIMPHLITNKNVVVISPLIALIKDQSNMIQKMNVPVCVLNSTNTQKTTEKKNILKGQNKIIFITPEYLELCKDFIVAMHKANSLCCIAIDESHCVSTFSDFRPSYTKLHVFKKWVPNVPILALTATASKKVREDIKKTLSVNPHVIIGGFDRPNLYLQVRPKSKNVQEDLKYLLEKYKNEYIIIYCKTRDETDNITEMINNMGINCLAYHAGLDSEIREETQNKFIEGQIKCIIATVAFGMGINVKNIRLVIHYGCPKNIESYYQEIGRAGRDGEFSECHMFYSNKDFAQNRYFIKEIKNETHRNYQSQQIQLIEKYVFSMECRRILLLKSFDEIINSNNCKNCDNCLKKKNIITFDFTVALYNLLILINDLNGKYGSTFLINIIRGSNAKNIYDHHKKNQVYGMGKKYSLLWWKNVVRILINQEYLKEVSLQGKFGSVIGSTDKSNLWLKTILMKYKNMDVFDLILTDENMSIDIADEDKIILPITQDFKKLIDKTNSQSSDI